MRELHGTIFASDNFSEQSLKQQSLLFDKFFVLGLDQYLSQFHEASEPAISSTFDYLISKGVVQPPPRFTGQLRFKGPVGFNESDESINLFHDLFVREAASGLSNEQSDVVPICSLPPPPWLSLESTSEPNNIEATVSVAIDALPVPDETCAWQDILDFKAELHDKQWGFRRWLHSVATKTLTESEVRDELEWTLNEYMKAMEIHRLKASQSFLDVFVVTPIEILENIVKFNWSKIAKGALQVRKRKVELMEAEMKAPGRECAYVFDARKRFGDP
jgi:hypothetical protein